MSFEVITVIVVLVFFIILSLMANKAERILSEEAKANLKINQAEKHQETRNS